MENYLYPDHQIDFIGDAEKNMVDFKWTDYVDKVYLLTIPKRMKRFVFAHNELNRLGIEDKDIMPYIGVQSPLYKYIYEKLYDDEFHPKEFNIVLHHYIMLRQAYDLGYNRIMICEDDARFLKNENLVKQQIAQLDFNNIDFVWLHKGQYMNFIVSFACYIINRKAMADYLDFIENRLHCHRFMHIDEFHCHVNHNKYWLRNDICVCKDIETNSNDYKWTHVINHNRYNETDYNL